MLHTETQHTNRWRRHECENWTRRLQWSHFQQKNQQKRSCTLTLIDECGVVLLYTKFHKSRGKLWTFVYPNGEKAQLDCILINNKWQSSAKNAKAYNSFSSVGSDHRIITAKLTLKLPASKPRKHQPKYDW